MTRRQTVRKRWFGRLLLLVLIGAVLYLPVRRELLDLGLIPAASFRSSSGMTLTLYGNGRYTLAQGKKTTGRFRKETYPDAPWISLIQLDSGLLLHVRYEDRVFRVEDIPDLEGATVKFVRQ
ncbi:MAG: hypothetical protein ACHQ50_14395 [Fimbriimonadales bacterium]